MIINILLILLLLVLVSLSLVYGYGVLTWMYTRVPYVRTPSPIVDTMVSLAGSNPKNSVYELGSGDGKVLFSYQESLSKNSKVSFAGYELNWFLVLFARIKNLARGSDVSFRCQDFFKTDLSDADVVFCYLWPSIMDRIYTEHWPTFAPGTRLVSHAFQIKSLTPAKIITHGKTKVYLYEK